MRRMYGAAYAALLLILGLYAEEAVTFIGHKTGYLDYPENSSNCRANPDRSGYAWCVVPGYGPTVFRHIDGGFHPVDPSLPEQSVQEFRDMNNTYQAMFGTEIPQHPLER